MCLIALVLFCNNNPDHMHRLILNDWPKLHRSYVSIHFVIIFSVFVVIEFMCAFLSGFKMFTTSNNATNVNV